jgi:type II restriction enzyme
MSSDDFFSTRVIKDKGELNNGVVYYLFVENFIDLKLELELARKYKSNSQKARILTETWVAEQIYCPSCGNPAIRRFKANRPVADFYCETCQEIYELKSKKSSIGKTLADGAYQTKIERLLSETNPNLFILTYDTGWSVTNFITIPKQFFVPSLIEKRKPLAKTARRAGWQGSNIIISDIPEMGKIYGVITESCV